MPKLLTFCLILRCSALLAQEPVHRPPLEGLLRRAGFTLNPAPGASGSHEVTIRWRSTPSTATAADALPPPTIDVQAVTAIHHAQPPPRQRSAEMSNDHLVAVILDAQGAARHWQIVVDPRFVRGEFPDAQGNLSKTMAYRQDVTLTVTVPDNIVAKEVRLLAPNWDRLGIVTLTPVATIALPAGVIK